MYHLRSVPERRYITGCVPHPPNGGIYEAYSGDDDHQVLSSLELLH